MTNLLSVVPRSNTHTLIFRFFSVITPRRQHVKNCWTLVIQMFLKVHTPKNVHPVKFQYITMSILLSYRGFLLLYSIQNEIFTGYGSPNILQYLSVLLDKWEVIGTPATIRHLGRKLIDPAVVTIHFSIVFLFTPFKISLLFFT